MANCPPPPDKQIQLRMGQANVLRWVDGLLPLLTDADPLGVDDFATHHLTRGTPGSARSWWMWATASEATVTVRVSGVS